MYQSSLRFNRYGYLISSILTIYKVYLKGSTGIIVRIDAFVILTLALCNVATKRFPRIQVS